MLGKWFKVVVGSGSGELAGVGLWQWGLGWKLAGVGLFDAKEGSVAVLGSIGGLVKVVETVGSGFERFRIS
ncbi:hypothetical protein V6N11_021771 [Hibiscus sabdariffa]|uniref:Uncharacterized protein n=1 Tax=Hibiscus sabdariffa TaxID=183260 RepID=A0ABR2THP2_9ROSI